MRNTTSIENAMARISAKTDRSGGPLACHLWRGNTGQWGGPTLPMTRPGGVKGGGSVRRMLWESIHGPLEKTRRVRVTCGNIGCVNLAHMTLEPVKDPVPRFWKNVNKLAPNGCWEWMATRSVESRSSARHRRGAGYGNFMATALTRVAAHRFSWELHNGPIPEGLIVMHTCDNPPCVNPAHLRLGTLKDNTRDMLTKGRGFMQKRKQERLAREASQTGRPDHGK